MNNTPNRLIEEYPLALGFECIETIEPHKCANCSRNAEDNGYLWISHDRETALCRQCFKARQNPTTYHFSCGYMGHTYFKWHCPHCRYEHEFKVRRGTPSEYEQSITNGGPEAIPDWKDGQITAHTEIPDYVLNELALYIPNAIVRTAEYLNHKCA